MKTLFLAIICFSFSLTAQTVLDQVVAVVDNEIILQSELDFQTRMFASQRKLDPSDPQVRQQVLKAMLEEKLIYAQANLDSIIVAEEDVNRQIEYQINVLISQYGSRERVEELYGMGLERIKRELRDDVRKNLMTQRLQEKKFGLLESTRREVESFFETYKDSIGVIPEKVRIAHIFVNPKTSDRIKNRTREFAESLLDSINKGADFSELAKKYSDDPGSAAQGGNLGFVNRGVFYPEFEAVAFALEPGQLSGIVESPVGFHIIHLLERRGESINSRHILVKIKADEEADLEAIQYLNDMRDSINNEQGQFRDFARKYSDDKESANLGGVLGTFYLNQLDRTMLDAIARLKPGEISFPRRVEYGAGSYGYHIINLIDRIPQHLPDLEIDYQDIKKLADEYKKQKMYIEWIEDLKEKIYWEIRI